ncbi:MAG: glycosyltransferase family 39 protein [Kiritimatiellae bacterium]|nr:glycosyltransferase family 39 protein [Kiritimatiellia bacterium]
MAAKPFESRIQDLIYNVDVGIGLWLMKIGLYLLFVLITMLLYTATQFRGLKEPAAMDAAQLGRNLATHHRFITQNIRPASLWFLARRNPAAGLRMDRHPDIVNAPLWPMALGAVFKMAGTSFSSDKPAAVFAPEQWIVVPLGHFFTLLTGLVLFFFGRRLFDRRVAVLGVTLYFLSDTIWRNSISGLGLSMLMFFVVTAFYLAYLAAAGPTEDGRATGKGLLQLAGSALLCILAFHTRYASAVFVPALAVYIGVSFRKKGWRWASLFLLAFLLGITPWLVRNTMVSGNPLGMTAHLALNGTDSFAGNGFDRALKPALTLDKVFRDLQTKWMGGLARFYRQDLWKTGDGLLFGLFLAALFFRFVNTPAHRLRWCLVLAIGLLWLVAALFGEETARLLNVCWPIALLFGLAFFFVLLDRLQLQARLFELAVIVAVAVTSALPLAFALLPPRAGPPYPPYFPPYIMHVTRMLTPAEMMCSDMPWATAWYGDRASLLLPSTLDDFYEINDYHRRIYGLYFTTITRDKPFVSGLVAGPERSWFPILEGRIPGDFPLTQGFPINNMDQLFLTDRERWSRR